MTALERIKGIEKQKAGARYEFLLKAFRVMRKIAIVNTAQEYQSRGAEERIDSLFEEWMGK